MLPGSSLRLSVVEKGGLLSISLIYQNLHICIELDGKSPYFRLVNIKIVVKGGLTEAIISKRIQQILRNSQMMVELIIVCILSMIFNRTSHRYISL
jgi:hypothetical protein